ncbi:thiol:disulfide interchange protein DsbG [Bordetella genomosp. 12]|uniref:Thiol:disulfide interchange protein n=1 Tax=Bordetella genomosp. 12 TaxID=463035 RepID=A0A261VE70_9BORD|nr:thiol:disulfide interchange protein DsbG [Bordetella genomosp. 12]OZI71463.1 thiol:disulfide interchange protein DsbG [Bordetella genomosp. 12]
MPSTKIFAQLLLGLAACMMAPYTAAEDAPAIPRAAELAPGQDPASRQRQPNTKSEPIWKQLAAATWVADGKADAPRVVYTFSDPNCPYCQRFSEAARPWVDAGKVQLRHLLIGLISPSSSTKAAAILTAPDSTAALRENERHFRRGGILAAADVPQAIRSRLDQNRDLMASLGFRGTPGILYLDDAGQLQRLNGLPRAGAWERILGRK